VLRGQLLGEQITERYGVTMVERFPKRDRKNLPLPPNVAALCFPDNADLEGLSRPRRPSKYASPTDDWGFEPPTENSESTSESANGREVKGTGSSKSNGNSNSKRDGDVESGADTREDEGDQFFNFVLTTLTGRRLYGASLLLRHPSRPHEVLCVCVLSALPLLQHLRDALATLLDAPSDTVEELLGCDPFQRLVAFTRPCKVCTHTHTHTHTHIHLHTIAHTLSHTHKAPVDLFGSEASPLRVSVCV
jgi:hypothetical protein